PALHPLAGVGAQVPRAIHLKVAGASIEGGALRVVDHEETIALHRGVQETGAGLQRALRELANRKRPARAETNLRLAQSCVERLRHQVAEIDRAGLEARSVEIRQIVAYH